MNRVETNQPQIQNLKSKILPGRFLHNRDFLVGQVVEFVDEAVDLALEGRLLVRRARGRQPHLTS